MKNNVAPPESSNSKIARHKHFSVEEAKKTNLKNNFIKIIKDLNEEMKTSLK